MMKLTNSRISKNEQTLVIKSLIDNELVLYWEANKVKTEEVNLVQKYLNLGNIMDNQTYLDIISASKFKKRMMKLLTEVKYKIIYQIFIKDLNNVNWKFDEGVKIYVTYLIKKNLLKVDNVEQEYIFLLILMKTILECVIIRMFC